jgi:hypothetical protein
LFGLGLHQKSSAAIVALQMQRSEGLLFNYCLGWDFITKNPALPSLHCKCQGASLYPNGAASALEIARVMSKTDMNLFSSYQMTILRSLKLQPESLAGLE